MKKERFAGIFAETGELPTYHIQYVEVDKEYRYYQPLTVEKMCLTCHGHLDQCETKPRIKRIFK